VPAVEALLGNTALLLHSLSHHAGVVTTPRAISDPVRQVEFVKLRESRVLVVFVSEAGLVTNKLMQLDRPIETSELERAANYINEKLKQGSWSTLRERILQEMRADQTALHALIETALRLAEKNLDSGAGGSAMLVEGEESFLDAPEYADVQKARALLRAFSEKDRILRVLDRVTRAREVQIFIGAESELATLPDVSVVAAPYGRGDTVLGTLAVIGPTRMNYARVIPLVDLTAREISRALSGGES
jgi:heat-inducible transcriptional repressor